MTCSTLLVANVVTIMVKTTVINVMAHLSCTTLANVFVTVLKGTVSRYIDKNRTGACGLGQNRRLLRHTELVFLSTVCARRVVLVLFTNMDDVN